MSREKTCGRCGISSTHPIGVETNDDFVAALKKEAGSSRYERSKRGIRTIFSWPNTDMPLPAMETGVWRSVMEFC